MLITKLFHKKQPPPPKLQVFWQTFTSSVIPQFDLTRQTDQYQDLVNLCVITIDTRVH